MFPIVRWLPRYSFSNDFGFDLISGLTVGLLAIPQSISYAAIAGLPVQYGLYSDLQFLYPIFGTSPYLIIGPVAVMSLLSAKTISILNTGTHDDDNLTSFEKNWGLTDEERIEITCLTCFLIGSLQILASRFRLGEKLQSSGMFPEIVVFSFTFSAALLILSTQIGFIILNKTCKDCSLIDLASKAAESPITSLLMLLYSITNLFLLKMIKSYNNLGPLFVMLIGILFQIFLEKVLHREGLLSVGYVPSGLPTPRFNLFDSFKALTSHLTSILQALNFCLNLVLMAALGYTEAIAIAKATAPIGIASEYLLPTPAYESVGEGVINPIEEDQELLALGMCNILTYSLGGYSVTGSFSRTAVNKESGAKSPISSLVACAVVLMVLIVFAPLLKHLPKATVSSVVIMAVVKLIKFEEIMHLWRRFSERDRSGTVQVREDYHFVVFIVSVTASLFLGIELGLLVAIISNQLLNRIIITQ